MGAWSGCSASQGLAVFPAEIKPPGLGPCPVVEGLQWEAQPSIAPVTQTQGHMGTCKHPKG